MDKNKPIIICDLDDVICQTAIEQINWLREKRGLEFEFDDLVDWWHVRSEIKRIYNLSEAAADKISNEPFYTEGFFANLKPMPGAVEGVKELIDYGFKIVIATKALYSSKHAYSEKFYYVRNLFGDLADNMPFICTGDKSFVRGSILIDDNTRNIERAMDSHYTMLFDRPWNRKTKIYHERVFNWEDIVQRLKKMFPVSPKLANYGVKYYQESKMLAINKEDEVETTYAGNFDVYRGGHTDKFYL